MIRGRVGVEPKLLRELLSSSAIVETDKTNNDNWFGLTVGEGGVLIAPEVTCLGSDWSAPLVTWNLIG